LCRFLNRHDDARLLVVADRLPQFSSLKAKQWSFYPWSEADEADAIAAMDVGLMPLPDNEWTRGKCSFKMLQYMACGKPVVVSPVGMNGELLRTAEIGFGAVAAEEWLSALEALYSNPGAAHEFGRNGRQLVERSYSLDVVGARLAELLHEVS